MVGSRFQRAIDFTDNIDNNHEIRISVIIVSGYRELDFCNH